MNGLLPDTVQDALNALSARCSEHNIKLDNVVFSRRQAKPAQHTYLLMTPGGVVHVKQEL